jgi:membrane protease YdiL (CAAX protease family)
LLISVFGAFPSLDSSAYLACIGIGFEVIYASDLPFYEPTMMNLFLREGRLRSGWRVVSYVLISRLALVALAVLVGLLLAFYLISQGTSFGGLSQRMMDILTALPGLTIAEIIQLALTVGLVYLWRRRVDKRSFGSLGIRFKRGWWQEFLLGAGLVGLMWTFMFLLALSTMSISIEGIRIDPTSLAGGLGLGLAFNILVGLNEELDARGYILQNLAEGVGFAPAVLVSAVYFGALHLLNPGASAASTLGVALFGVLAALGYRATGQLWMPIGMHAAWNFFEGPIYGFLVSGVNMGGVFTLRVNGPEWLTGGSFGPEAGALTMAPMVIMIGAVYFWGLGRRGSTTEG